MHTSSLLYLLGMCSAYAHALAIPQPDNGGLVSRGGWSGDTSIPADILKRAGSAKPAPVKKPAPGGKPGATPKPTPKPTPTPVAGPVKWADVKVPYVTTAFDTCGIFVECDESEVEDGNLVARGDALAVTITHDAVGIPTQTPAPALVGRDIRTFKPAGFPAAFSIKNLDYPGAPDLFTPPKGAKVKVNVFDYSSDKVADYKVKNLKAKPVKYDDYVTEHIVELQTVKIFIESVAKDTKVKNFIEKWWNADLDPTKVANRPNKPPITMGDRKTINHLVFEALGSDDNREDFVLCEKEINGYKARIWDTISPMAPGKYKTAVKDAVSGALDSNMYLSALRSTLAVFEYLQDKEVTSRLQASIKNVGTELKNIEHLTTEKVNLAALWEAFMRSHLTAVETEAKKWIKDRIVSDTEEEVKKMITALKKKETDLKAKETGKKKADHKKKAKADLDKLDKEIKTAEADVEAQKKVVKAKDDDLKLKREAFNKKSTKLRKKNDELATLKKNIAKEKDAKKKANLEKQEKTLEADKTKLEAEKKKAEGDRKAADKARTKTRNDLIKKQKVVGLKNREKFSLRSVWLKEVINDLENDQKIVAAFKTAGAAIKAPSAV